MSVIVPINMVGVSLFSCPIYVNQRFGRKLRDILETGFVPCCRRTIISFLFFKNIVLNNLGTMSASGKSGPVEGESMMASITASIWANDNLVEERQYYKRSWWFRDARKFMKVGRRFHCQFLPCK